MRTLLNLYRSTRRDKRRITQTDKLFSSRSMSFDMSTHSPMYNQSTLSFLIWFNMGQTLENTSIGQTEPEEIPYIVCYINN